MDCLKLLHYHDNDENQFAIDKPLKRKNLYDEQKKLYLGKGFFNSLSTYLNEPL